MHIFDHDISLTKKGDLRYDIDISDNWSINGNPNGGFLSAILAGAMLKESEKKFTAIITTSYISLCPPGKASIFIEKLSNSRGFNRLEARLIMDGKEMVRALGTFTGGDEKYIRKRYERRAPRVSARDLCVRHPKITGFTLHNQMDILIDPDTAGWIRGDLSDKSEIRGWIKFRAERPFDCLSILLIADSFPPPVFASQGRVAWVPTIELSVNVRNIPETKWLKAIFRTSFINNGILEEDGEIWDEKGELVAISRQIAQFRNGQ